MVKKKQNLFLLVFAAWQVPKIKKGILNQTGTFQVGALLKAQKAQTFKNMFRTIF